MKINLIPAIIQNNKTGKVLMLGYMNKEALEKTKETGKVWFYSRSRRRLWMKGETSGNLLNVISINEDCDRDTLLIKVAPAGPTCHKGTESCFDSCKNVPGNTYKSGIFAELFAVIRDRKKEMPQNSYTTSLFRKGTNKICAKIKEESAEVIKSAKKETRRRLTEESVDLLYHLFVLLAAKNITLKELKKEIKKRRK